MASTAKLFWNGRSQAIRLPAIFRFDCKEVFIRRDPKTGDVIISRKPGTWQEYFELMKKIEIPGDFMSDRKDDLPQERELF